MRLVRSLAPPEEPIAMRERILITGPGGRVGTHIVPLLRPHFALRLFDAQQLAAEADDEVLQGDIRDFAAVRAACDGVRAVVHLAAVADEDDFVTRLLPMNVLGVYNVFEAARQAGARKVVFTSTGQTVLNYGLDAWVTPDMPVRPWTLYACTKVFGEAAARYYSETFGMSMICIRLGWFQPRESAAWKEERDKAGHWCSPRDLAQLIEKALRGDVAFGIFFGVSNNTGLRWDISNARELLGYEPEDDSAQVDLQ
jgi:NAD+ dependent glucose-6-phosphate dehydrogenase